MVGDRLELAPDALGGVGLQVERVEMAEPAGQEDQDHRIRRDARVLIADRSAIGACPPASNPGVRPEESGEPDLKEIAAGGSPEAGRPA